MTLLARLVFAVLIAAGLGACVGTDAPRKAGARPRVRPQKPPNPNADLVRPPKERRKIRPAGPRTVGPANSWYAHDREVHAAIPKEQAQSAARVYPWFEVPTYTPAGSELVEGDGDEDEDE